jgi:hypothetical protein
LNDIWEPLTRENPLERSISREGIEQLNRLVDTYLPFALNQNYQPARIYAPAPDRRFEISCISIDFPRMKLSATRIPQKRLRPGLFVVEVDDDGEVRRMRPDPTKGIRKLFEDSEEARAKITDFVRKLFEIDQKRRALA